MQQQLLFNMENRKITKDGLIPRPTPNPNKDGKDTKKNPTPPKREKKILHD